MARILLRQRFDEILDDRLDEMAEDVERELRTHARVDTGLMRVRTQTWVRYSGSSTGGRGLTIRVNVPYAGIVDAIYGYGRSTQADFNSGPTVIELVQRGMQVGLRVPGGASITESRGATGEPGERRRSFANRGRTVRTGDRAALRRLNRQLERLLRGGA